MRDSSLAAGTIASLLVVRFRFTLSRGQRPTRGASGPALTMARREHFGELVLDLCYRKAGDSLEVANVQCCDSIAEMQRRRANQQVLEGDAYTACRLFSLDASCKLRDLHGHGVHHHVAAEFFGKGSPPLAVRIALGPVDAVGQFDDSYNREGGVNFPLRSLHPLEDFPHTFLAALSCDKHAGVEDYSHVETLRGLRLLMISSRSAAKSGSSVGS